MTNELFERLLYEEKGTTIDFKKEQLPDPADPDDFTRVKDPNEPFQFSFTDLAGNLVSNTDPRFQNKVVLVNATGTWCPNCHDEAPFLEDLYRKYHAQGLEIVALDFENPSSVKIPRACVYQKVRYRVHLPASR